MTIFDDGKNDFSRDDDNNNDDDDELMVMTVVHERYHITDEIMDDMWCDGDEYGTHMVQVVMLYLARTITKHLPNST